MNTRTAKIITVSEAGTVSRGARWERAVGILKGRAADVRREIKTTRRAWEKRLRARG